MGHDENGHFCMFIGTHHSAPRTDLIVYEKRDLLPITETDNNHKPTKKCIFHKHCSHPILWAIYQPCTWLLSLLLALSASLQSLPNVQNLILYLARFCRSVLDFGSQLDKCTILTESSSCSCAHVFGPRYLVILLVTNNTNKES